MNCEPMQNVECGESAFRRASFLLHGCQDLRKTGSHDTLGVKQFPELDICRPCLLASPARMGTVACGVTRTLETREAPMISTRLGIRPPVCRPV
jgi:hypothetical protein